MAAATTLSSHHFHQLIREILQVLSDGGTGRGHDATATAQPTWESAALRCVRMLVKWGGRLGRSALQSQLWTDMTDERKTSVPRAGSAPVAASSERTLERATRARSPSRKGRGEANGEEGHLLEVIVNSLERIDGASPALLLATVRAADASAGDESATTAVMGLPERVCALADKPGMAFLVKPGMLLRVARARAPIDQAPIGTFAFPHLLPSELTVIVLQSGDEDDEMSAMCAMTHTLAQLDHSAYARGERYTILCRVVAFADAGAGEHRRARLLLADASEARVTLAAGGLFIVGADGSTPLASAELVLTGDSAELANLCGSQAESGCTPLGALLLLHEPHVEQARADSGERAVLSYGLRTVVVAFASSPRDRAPDAPMRDAYEGEGARALAVDGARVEPTRLLLGSCCGGSHSEGWGGQAPSPLERTEGGRVRLAVRVEPIPPLAGLDSDTPLAQIASNAQAGVSRVVRLCCPAKGVHDNLWIPSGRVASAEPRKAACTPCVLAQVPLHAGAPPLASGSATGGLRPHELAFVSLCQCTECAAERLAARGLATTSAAGAERFEAIEVFVLMSQSSVLHTVPAWSGPI